MRISTTDIAVGVLAVAVMFLFIYTVLTRCRCYHHREGFETKAPPPKPADDKKEPPKVEEDIPLGDITLDKCQRVADDTKEGQARRDRIRERAKSDKKIPDIDEYRSTCMDQYGNKLVKPVWN